MGKLEEKATLLTQKILFSIGLHIQPHMWVQENFKNIGERGSLANRRALSTNGSGFESKCQES